MTTRTCRQVPASPAPYMAQDGWFTDGSGMTRKPRMVEIKHAFEPGPCRYDKQAEDKECAGCTRRAQQGE